MSALADPIPGDAPAGVYLKADRAAYRALRNAFNAAQSAWRAFSETPESLNDRELERGNQAAWAALAELAEDTLTTRSKDLEIFCWYVGAQAHAREPLPATEAALSALADLLEAGIEALQPIPPDDKLRGETEAARAAEIAELKLRPFVQLFGEVEGAGLLYAPLTNLRLAGEVSFGRYMMAERAGDLGALRAEFAAELPTAGDLVIARAGALGGIAAALGRLSGPLRAYAGAHGHTPPVIAPLERHVGAMQAALAALAEGTGLVLPGTGSGTGSGSGPEPLAPEASAELEAGQEPSATPGQPAPGGVAIGTLAAGALANREAALAQLAEIARYFRKTEPHSPLHLLLDRALRWGRMPAGALYAELLGEGSPALAQVSMLTGLESAGFADGVAPAPAMAPPPVEALPPRPGPAAAPPPPAPPPEAEAPSAPEAEPAPAEEAPPRPRPIKSFEL